MIKLGNFKEHVKSISYTALYVSFILVGALGALSLRGDIKTTINFQQLLGNVLVVFVVMTLISLVYKSNKK